MRHLVLVAALAAPLAAAPPASAAAGPRALLVSCTGGPALADRSAVFEGRMRTRPGTAHMEMRFRLKMRADGDSRWRPVQDAGMGAWVRSEHGVARYVFTKTVRRLPAPARYRMVIQFRWLDAHHRVMARSRARSRPCRQRDVRADLQLDRVKRVMGALPGFEGYEITVRNKGRSPSGQFALQLTVAGVAQPLLDMPSLDRKERFTVTVQAPACLPGALVGVLVDATEAVDEVREDDNALVAPCEA